ncbi:MAG: P-II family nitrogen regulator [Acidipropionibacterium sp.]|jgi:nitrogen regulatory protein PII|nr:P-II family nitrogen regulator [Acidipropionibacterium sp.]
MQLITAILQPSALDPVKSALADAGITGMTVYDAKGHGAQSGTVEVYRSQKVHVEFLPKICIEVVVTDEAVDTVISVIREAAYTGQIGNGKIWASPVSRIVRVRTGETGEDAV